MLSGFIGSHLSRNPSGRSTPSNDVYGGFRLDSVSKSAATQRVQRCKELSGCCPDPNAVDVVDVEAYCSGPEWIVVDEHALDDGSNGLGTISADNSRHRLVQVSVLMIFSWGLRSFEDELDHIVDRCVVGLPSSFTSVVEWLRRGHCVSLRGVGVRISRSRIGSLFSSDRSQCLFEDFHIVDRRELVGDFIYERRSLDGVGLPLDCLSRIGKLPRPSGRGSLSRSLGSLIGQRRHVEGGVMSVVGEDVIDI